MLTLGKIREAQERIAPFVRETPVLRAPALDRIARHPLYFKCENLQVGGAFKARGAFNAVYSLSDAAAVRGVTTHSSGNHAAAVALAAKSRGIRAWIVMPRTVARPKKRVVEETGAEIILCEPTMEAREEAAREVLGKTGSRFIHPYDDCEVMAGQGTAALAFIEQARDLELLLIPVSGGGLAAGTIAAAKEVSPQMRVIAVEPEGAADTWESMRAGRRMPLVNPRTIADGLRASIGENTFPILRDRLDGVVTVSEESIVRAMRQLWEELRVIVEPSSAVPWAAILEGKIALRGPTGIILTGGNVDLDRLPWIQGGR